MPTSSASGTVASIRSDRSRPGSSVTSHGAKEEDHFDENEGRDLTKTVKLATVTSTDRSTYHGEVNGGDKYIGQWVDGSRHGVGVSVDAEAVMTAAHFNMDEPELASAVSLSWEADVQLHVLRAVLAEDAAIRNQEIARQRHVDAVVQEMTTIGFETFNTTEEIEAFEAKDELETVEFIRDQSKQMHEVNAVAGELKFTEAQLTQRQKELRAEITAKRQELSLVAKYCALAETRGAQVREAERTLATLQRQLDVLNSESA
ncbi:Calcium permeable stress-gated cation channel 1 [Phytophthora nicotianae]|uniref:Calcium permeable stress-gated cation channel 1 n=1 Tax=Phytophthora nicotianae TaxID=4792 RepID=A0A0W8DR61_PHYNI|nr:Calcium permeable stress-gated cation channel 1 [Phytophthora nicotianae]